ncbi:unnamed protein product [Pleuronectes platessa]|uniref:Uncharacterized protein n=1 Tax=Pleuronectes platessa TaxID=8262 RepID=A0A9N7VDC7_PLEPL|nr:unnamed protein product [Pleuronectes platessa]
MRRNRVCPRGPTARGHQLLSVITAVLSSLGCEHWFFTGNSNDTVVRNPLKKKTPTVPTKRSTWRQTRIQTYTREQEGRNNTSKLSEESEGAQREDRTQLSSMAAIVSPPRSSSTFQPQEQIQDSSGLAGPELCGRPTPWIPAPTCPATDEALFLGRCRLSMGQHTQDFVKRWDVKHEK